MTEQEFIQLYDELADKLFRHCYFRVFNREKARDLMQECFMRVWKYCEAGHEVQNPKSFIYRVANNLIIDESRKKKELSLEELMTEGTESGEEHIREFDSGLHEADAVLTLIDGKIALTTLGQLNKKYRDAIILRYIDDLSPEEIAHITGETADVISVRIHRGLKQLRALLAPPQPI